MKKQRVGRMGRSFVNDLLISAVMNFEAAAEAAELTSNQEIEYTMYFNLTDPNQLLSASTITDQEQWELTLPEPESKVASGRMRVRSERPRQDPTAKYTLTLKVARPGVTGRKELELLIDEEYFENFKVFCQNGMRKTRFTFPIEGTEGTWTDGRYDTRLCWEVDVFNAPESFEGELWVKVDLEVPKPLEAVPKFPLAHNKAITNQWDKRTPEEQAFVKQLFDKVYL